MPNVDTRPTVDSVTTSASLPKQMRRSSRSTTLCQVTSTLVLVYLCACMPALCSASVGDNTVHLGATNMDTLGDAAAASSTHRNIVNNNNNNINEPTNSSVSLRTNIGSMLHEQCCRQHPAGLYCNSNYKFLHTLNPFGNAHDDTVPCTREWRKEIWDTVLGFSWTHYIRNINESTDFSPVPDLHRRAWLPDGLISDYLPSHYETQEVVVTASVCAPQGSELSCPTADPHCKFFCVGAAFTCLTCSPDDKGCNMYQQSLWEKHGREHSTAGDSDYCCSGKFSRVGKTLFGIGYGVCV